MLRCIVNVFCVEDPSFEIGRDCWLFGEACLDLQQSSNYLGDG